MKKLLRDIRLLPVVLAAVVALAVLKTAGLLIDGGYMFTRSAETAQAQQAAPQSAATQSSWAQDVFHFPGGRKVEEADVTGSVAGPPKTEAAPATKPAEAKPLEGIPVFPDPREQVSPSERAVLERLQARRQELDARARELEIRENLIKAAEKRLETKAEEIKATEQRANAAGERKAEADVVRLKGLVTMYEGMKPKDAAKIFDRLEMAVLFDIASQIKPAKMSDVLAQMSPEAAERLTVELARRAGGGEKPASVVDLPKIEGKPK
jgi:flagellar motility protein MotE (MotC chaperone)